MFDRFDEARASLVAVDARARRVRSCRRAIRRSRSRQSGRRPRDDPDLAPSEGARAAHDALAGCRSTSRPASVRRHAPTSLRLVDLEIGHDAASEPASDEHVKVVGPLRIGIPLFNIYLNEADELSRRLMTEVAEWAMELHRPVGEVPIALAHSLAGSSATVGFTDLSHLARSLEHALARTQVIGHGTDDEARLFVNAAEDIRRLLHQFAAGFLQQPAPELLVRLAEHEVSSAMRLEAATAASELAEAQDSASPIEPAIAVEPLLTLDGIDDRARRERRVRRGAPVGQGPLAAPRADAEAAPPAGDECRASGEVVAADAGRPSRSRAPRRRRASRRRRAGAPRRHAGDATPSMFGGLGSFTARRRRAQAARRGAGRARPCDAGAAVDVRRRRRRDRRDRRGRHRAVPDLRGRSAGAPAQARRPAARLAGRARESSHASACMRTLHTLKGGARLAGAMRLGEMAHRLETRIERLTATDAPRTRPRTSRRCSPSPTR
jgi:chemosensory pili system protein ChpA (sensor histidine kinase/response regulator)